MIKSFKCKETEKLFNRIATRKIAPIIHRAALRKLRMLNEAKNINDLRRPPGNRLEMLVGNKAGQYSIRINDRYRICFVWQAGDKFDVKIVDYH